MPKKTVHSRSGAQRSKAKQKSFELVRAEKTALETVESQEEIEEGDEAVSEKEETTETDEAEERVSVKEKVQTAKPSSAKESLPSVTITNSSSDDAPQSASVRLAARRQMAQKEKAQRTSANLITAENYAYVRKDLLFILILAIIMFSAIIIMHFVPAIGG